MDETAKLGYEGSGHGVSEVGEGAAHRDYLSDISHCSVSVNSGITLNCRGMHYGCDNLGEPP
jgi:hypothetical protein